MCGLVGMVGYIDVREKKAFKDLLRMDTVRGYHSVGIYSKGVTKDGLFKKALSPDEMFSMQGCSNLLLQPTNLYIGHNRWATQGKVNGVNAHPFEQGIIIGAHNGTLRQQGLLKDHLMFEVDSENIMYNLGEEGVDATVKKLDGAYALTWYNQETETLNFVRNKERPLWRCWSTDHKTMFWASEEWMLYGALGRNGIAFNQPTLFDIDKHYFMDVPNEYAGQAKTLKKINVRHVEPYIAPPLPAKTSYNSYDSRKGHNKGNGVTTIPIGFTKGDKIRIGDTIYFWQGTLENNGFTMDCPVESSHGYDARIHFGGADRVKKLMMDDKLGDCLFQGVVMGSQAGTFPAVIISPNTVHQVTAKKQQELLKGTMV